MSASEKTKPRIKKLSCYRLSLGLIVIFISFFHFQCQPKFEPGTTELPVRQDFIVERDGNTIFLQIYADSFSKLPFKQKMYAYHLYCASLTGREIAFDQIHRFAPDIKNLMEEILLNGVKLDSVTYGKILKYTKRLWLNNGQYDRLDLRKFVLDITPEELYQAAQLAASYGAKFENDNGYNLKEQVYLLSPHLFNPNIEPVLIKQSKGKKDDPFSGMALNLYFKVSGEDLKKYKDKYPLNSRLRKINGKIVEEVYRSGNDEIPPGRFSAVFENICNELKLAKGFADPKQQNYLVRLIHFLQTGVEMQSSDSSASAGDSIGAFIGFVPSEWDPRGIKGEFLGEVFFTAPKTTLLEYKYHKNFKKLIRKIDFPEGITVVQNNDHNHHPLELLIGVGKSWPIYTKSLTEFPKTGVPAPHISGDVYFRNVEEAFDACLNRLLLEKLSGSEDEISAEQESGQIAWRYFLAARNVFSADLLSSMPEKGSLYQLSEALRDLLALYVITDPACFREEIIPEKNLPEIACRRYLRSCLREFGDSGLLKMRRHPYRDFILSRLLKNESAVKIENHNGKAHLILKDVSALRKEIGQIITEIDLILKQGNQEKADELINSAGSGIGAEFTKEIRKRIDSCNLPERVAVVFPDMIPVLNPEGRIKDIKLVYPRDFQAQMLKFSQCTPQTKSLKENK